MHHLSAKIRENRRNFLAFGRFSVQWFLGRKLGYFGKPIIPLRRSCDSVPDGLGFSPRTRISDRMPGGGPLLFAPDAVQVFCKNLHFQTVEQSNSQTVCAQTGNPHPGRVPSRWVASHICSGCQPGGARILRTTIPNWEQ